MLLKYGEPSKVRVVTLVRCSENINLLINEEVVVMLEIILQLINGK